MLCNIYIYIYTRLALLYSILNFGNGHVIPAYSETLFPMRIFIYSCTMLLKPGDTSEILNADP